MRACLPIGVLFLALGAAGCAGGNGERVIPTTALPNLVLQPEDLSAPFSRFDEGPLAMADTAEGERGDPARFGRTGGWKARYRRPGSASTPGPLVVESRVDLFSGSGGAGREFDAHRDELELQVVRPSVDLVELELGDEAVTLTPGPGVAAGSFVLHTIVWRYRNVTAALTANGFGGKLRLGDAVALARAQQRRIAAAAPAAEP